MNGGEWHGSVFDYFALLAPAFGDKLYASKTRLDAHSSITITIFQIMVVAGSVFKRKQPRP
jgi:hypothetical protein